MTSFARKVAELPSAVCCECGDKINHAELSDDGTATCSRCSAPLKPIMGAVGQGHWEDDESGASASWDRVVRMYEGG
jgi:predicted nucleic acid-binding Zn ribbon protein